MAIRKAGVVGCGLMGGGIAQTCAQSGYETVVLEVNQQLLDKGITRIHGAWDTMASKGKITQGQVDEYRARLHGTLEMTDFADCDLVIEAAIENMEEKLRLFPALDRVLKPEALLLSNTSSLNVTQMGAVTKRPDKVCGLHFFNPAPVMKLVEIVKTISTSEETIETVRQFAVYPMGPFTLLDYVGLDTTMWAAEAIYEEYKDPLYAPPPLLRRMVISGMLGKKSGKGFYDYQ